MVRRVQPIELIQLCGRLHESFDGHIVGVGATSVEQDRNFLTKALSAWYLMVEAGATREAAVDASVDGNNDHGIDSVFVDATDTIWLVQSKYINNGSGEPALGDVSKFKDGVCDLLRGRFERFNTNLSSKRQVIDRVIASGEAKCKAILLSTGSSFSDDRRALMHDLENTLNEPANPSLIRFSNVGLTTLHQMDLASSQAPPITLEIELENYGFVREPRLSYYGSLGGQQIADMSEEYGQRLFSANIRQFKGNTTVNSGIEETLKATPEDMFYFNNGVTFLCDDIQPVGYSAESRNIGTFRLLGASVINGAQTVSCISKVAATEPTEQAKVMVTVISKKNAPDGFSNEVTQYRNSQNMVSDIDFAALDENQQQWAMTLANSGVNYRYKGGLLDDETFDLEQAARALACAIAGDDGLRLVAQVKTNGNKLFSRTTNNAVTESPYKTVFPDTLQARVLWRTVQICEEVRRVVRHDQEGEQGIDRAVLINGTWMICHLVFCLLPELKREESLALTPDECQRVEDMTRQAAYQLITDFKNKYSSQSAESVFKNAAELSVLKGLVLTALIESPV